MIKPCNFITAFLKKKVLREDIKDVSDVACLISVGFHIGFARDLGATSRAASAQHKEHSGT